MSQVTVNFHSPTDATVVVDHEPAMYRAEMLVSNDGDYILTGPRESNGRRFATANSSPQSAINAYLVHLGINLVSVDIVEYHSDQGTGPLGTLTGALEDAQRIRNWAEAKANLNASDALDNLRMVARRLSVLVADHGKGGDA